MRRVFRASSIVTFLALALLAGCAEEPATPPTGALEQQEPAMEDADAHLGGGVPLDVTRVFFEFNATDNDLGFQLMLDGEPWRRLRVFDPNNDRILDFDASGPLRELGLTELVFESAEPSPEEVLALFPPGEYRFAGASVENERLQGSAILSHVLPPAPVFVNPSEDEVVDPEDFVIEWQEIGGLEGYEVIVENADTGASMTVQLDGDATSLGVPDEFLDEDTEYKVEILSISPNGNKTISEVTFFTK